jgi:transmembrane sensor
MNKYTKVVQDFIEKNYSHKNISELLKAALNPESISEKILEGHRDETLSDLKPELLEEATILATIRESLLMKISAHKKKQEAKTFYIWAGSIAATATLLLVAGIAWFGSHDAAILFENYEVTSTKEEKGEIILEDGTTVKINSGSVLKYPPSFLNYNERRIFLDGEAYFTVAKNKEKPFIINTPQGEIRVLGTVFNLRSYARDSMLTVGVSEGSVLLTNPAKASIQLTKGNVGISKGDSLFSFNTNTPSNFSSWHSKRLVFEGDSLGDVVQQLNYIFDTPIVLSSPASATKRLFANIPKTDINNVLRMITNKLGMTYTYTANGVIEIKERK